MDERRDGGGTTKIVLPNSVAAAYPLFLRDWNGVFYFSATDGLGGRELWKYVIGVGVTQLANLAAAGASSDPRDLKAIGNDLFFTADAGVLGRELYKTDGTAIGTVRVKDNNANGSSNPQYLTELNGLLYFSATDGESGREFWKSDGTEVGTILVAKIAGGEFDSDPQFLTALESILFFSADDALLGRELWKFDPSEAVASRVKDINSDAPFPVGVPRSSNPQYLTRVNDVVYFAADDGVNGVELWRSNGWEGETSLVIDIAPGTTSSMPSLLTDGLGALYFVANNGTEGEELWRSTGGPGETSFVDINPGGLGSSPTSLTIAGQRLYFAATDLSRGRELWDPPLEAIASDSEKSLGKEHPSIGAQPFVGESIIPIQISERPVVAQVDSTSRNGSVIALFPVEPQKSFNFVAGNAVSVRISDTSRSSPPILAAEQA